MILTGREEAHLLNACFRGVRRHQDALSPGSATAVRAKDSSVEPLWLELSGAKCCDVNRAKTSCAQMLCKRLSSQGYVSMHGTIRSDQS